ncbi:MAG: type II toxin-antitoxin system VapC family toxin [Bacteroidetes bacterium]|nr:type II toxin-antitoxin system VapC family toxin [Bacteroidota bacterium]MBI3481609.1 type II toxin-antitoxin system VapC family toxin [Bacteroidota bacterium]
MKYLMDSHILLWTLFKPSLLSQQVQIILNNTTNTVYVSSVSYFELSLKYSLGKLELKNYKPVDLLFEANKMGFQHLNLNSEDAAGIYLLEFKEHKDPFDRMLFWQAIKNNLKFITRDSKAAAYAQQGLEVIW